MTVPSTVQRKLVLILSMFYMLIHSLFVPCSFSLWLYRTLQPPVFMLLSLIFSPSWLLFVLLFFFHSFALTCQVGYSIFFSALAFNVFSACICQTLESFPFIVSLKFQHSLFFIIFDICFVELVYHILWYSQPFIGQTILFICGKKTVLFLLLYRSIGIT